MAPQQVLEKVFEAEGTLDIVFDFDEFAMGKFFPAGANGSFCAKALEEELDFVEREIHFSGEADEEQAIKGLHRVATLAVQAGGRIEQADFFVIADGGSVKAGIAREFSDFHSVPPH